MFSPKKGKHIYIYWNRKFNLQCLRVVTVPSSASPTSWCVYQWYAESSVLTGIFANAHTLETFPCTINEQDAARYLVCSQNCEKRTLASSQPVCPFVCLSVRMEQLGSHWTDICKIWHLSIFWKYVQKSQFSLNFDTYKWYFTLKTNIHLWE